MSTPPPDATPQPLATTQPDSPWLTLKDASAFLGVHFTTLRKWADEGEIRVFRTPGGHRRFSVADLRRFLEERVGHSSPPDADSVLDEAVGRVRAEIQRMPHDVGGWITSADESARDLSRQRGRRLFSLAISYVIKPAQRERLLDEGRQLGLAYGRAAANSRMALTETGRAVQFFRSQLNQVLRSHETSSVLDADDVRVQQIVNHFLDEVLYAVLNGYEQEMGRGEG
jgi:excisionase family DNA binding protein